MKKIFLSFICLILLCACSSKGEQNPIVTMDIENYGTIKIELYPNYAPNTVANFVNLIQEGFYNNNSFHRLVPGFVLQGGDPLGSGYGGPGYSIKGEFSENGYANNTLSHTTGIVSMARATAPDTAGSQFFIVLSDNAKYSLDGKYAAFGKVIEGMDIIKNIEKNEEIDNQKSGKLKENVIITNVTVDTFGKEYQTKKIAN